ncbi:MAG: hypothetical protein M3305_00865 [Actinomycetota bacterium]|nr:hypothetical protein [Actinomycetota bacterium]
MTRILYLATAALVAMLILVPTAFAQGTTERTISTESTQALPSSGGPAVVSLLVPAAALLGGSSVLAYAVLRRR